MDAMDLLKSRRSIRKYQDKLVSREDMDAIMEATRFAPSWCNLQVARYTLVTNPDTIAQLWEKGVHGFAYNIGTLKHAKNVAILSFVQGKSGKMGKAGYITDKENIWEVFDAGIACQTFCLAAHAQGVGTCIMGVIDAKNIAEIVGLPQEETVAAMITYGYPDEEVAPTDRLTPQEITRFVD